MSSRADVNPLTNVTDRLISEGEIARGVRSVQIVLYARDITISKEERERIVACTDPDLIKRWLQRAAFVDTVDQLFNWSGPEEDVGHHEYGGTETLTYGEEKLFIHGMAEGIIMSMRWLLKARGIALPYELLIQARCCTDLDQLERWVKCAGVIDSADQLLEWPHLQTELWFHPWPFARPTALQYFMEGHIRGAVKAILLTLAARNIPVSDEIYEHLASSAPRSDISELEQWLQNAAIIDNADQLFEESRAKGRARGVARSVLVFLASRRIEVSDEVRERITSCVDLDQLELWAQRAATVDTAEQLFD